MEKTKSELVSDIRHKQITLVFDEARLGDMRMQLSGALQAKASLEESKPEHRSALARVALGFGSAALGFGVATEALGDLASAGAIRSQFLGNHVSQFEKISEVRRLMERDGLCWNGQGPNPVGRAPLLKSTIPVLAGGAATYGLLALTQPLGTKEKPVRGTVAARPEPDATPDDDATLEALTEADLKKIDKELSQRLSETAKASRELGRELEGVQTKVIALHFGGSKKADLSKLGDEELRALARQVIASGNVKHESFLGDLGLWDGLGIYAGFGFGTKVLHGMYDGLAPWRPWIHAGKQNLSLQARNAAAAELKALQEGPNPVLAPCPKEPAAPSLREFTEADYAGLLEGWAPLETADAVDWKSVPGELASFFSPYRYETPGADNRWKWDLLLEKSADALAKRYAHNPAEDRSIREAVGKFASAYRESGYTYGTELNLLKWSLQGYVADLERGRIPSKAEVDGVLALTMTDRLENGAAAAYFKIRHLAHEQKAAPARSFEDASQAYWRRIDGWMDSDARPAAPVVNPKVTIYLPLPDVGIARMLAAFAGEQVATAAAAEGVWEGALAGAL